MLPVKLRAAKFVMTCTEKNRVHLSGLAPDHAQKIKHVYHGLDLRKFREDASFHKNDDSMLRILSIGTLYRTKGFDVLIEACALLKKQAVPFQCKIVGDGPERDRLQRQISSLGLGEDVTLMGYLDQEAFAVAAALGKCVRPFATAIFALGIAECLHRIARQQTCCAGNTSKCH